MKSILARTLQTALAPALAFALAAPLMAAEPAAPAKPDLAKGQATAQVCAACHAADGTRGIPSNPILQGQHPEYLVKQLTEFKAGKRQNPIMQGMAASLSEEDMRNVAAFYASKQAEPGAATDKDLVLLGEKIYRGGIAERNVPACAGCHSPSGAGIPAQYPRLAGQHAEYTAAQLNAFRAGARANSTQMVGVAAKMNDREIKAVSDYIAGLR
ncbi:cytochrome c4 [Azohydromonas sp. G-1-1-14]|uniref:Cytochrome c4 n=2 Tax=Azohydromonas caseinilytica TaxID=2728836 RepID=A0A848F7Q9_9BURK|nr:c-type cytochrome [Azohydromonas caseinilytica]NML15208.1 cytochrome c4 [Azohydromonas caseinilytica]